jgi:hypothetical protein
MAEKGGQPGNKNAVKERRMITSALTRAVAQNPEKLRKACLKVLDDAVEGNLAAFNTIADRLDGKPAQTNILTGDEDNPITIQEIARRIIDPNIGNTDS